MFSTLCSIVETIIEFFAAFSIKLGPDIIFIVALAVEALLVVFFLVKSAFSYESALNRSLDKLNYWLFEKKVVTEENIKELNMLMKTRAPQRVCYYWQQYILFREGNPSSYLSTENLVEKPLKTSSYNSNMKNLSLFSTLWALVSAMFVLFVEGYNSQLSGKLTATALIVPVFVMLIGLIFVAYLRARKNSILNSLYQNVALFGRFMDNACIDLPTYIDYQILFTPQEIEKGQPVLREFLDYKARKEKEEFKKAKEEEVQFESYDFASTGVDGSIVLDRAMKESELFLKKQDKILVKISQLEAELDSRRKNFDNVQKDYQTKIQASKENISRLRQMQEETTNRIESNYYRKQQTQEIGKQEQYEQEFEQLRAKYLLEKNEGEEEIQKLNDELARYKKDVENAMLGEYQTFFDKFCQSAEKVLAKVFNEKISTLKQENEQNKQYITELEIKLKNTPQGIFDASQMEAVQPQVQEVPQEGQFDENGNFVYPNGTFYDRDGNFHDENGNVYSQDGNLISEAPKQEVEQPQEKKIIDFDDFDSFDFMTDASQKGDIYSVAENVINEVDGDIEVVNNTQKTDILKGREESVEEKEETPVVKPLVDDDAFESFSLEPKVEEVPEELIEEVQEEPVAPKRKAGRPRKIVAETAQEEKPAKRPGRPRKVVQEQVAQEPKKKVGRPKKVVKQPVVAEPAKRPGRPRKVVEAKVEETPVRRPGRPKKVVQEQVAQEPKKKAGRPKKIVKEVETETEKRGRGRPKKIDSIMEINKRLSEEEAKLSAMRKSLNKELESAMNEMNGNADTKQSRRGELIKEIEILQKEAQKVIAQGESENKIAEINNKLEALLDEVKKINS